MLISIPHARFAISAAPFARSLFPVSVILIFLLVVLILSAGMFGYFEATYRAASAISLGTWESISTFGDVRALFALLLPLSLRYRKVIWPIILAALIGWLLTYGLKHLLHVPRPGQFFQVDPRLTQSESMGHFSTPSNHAVMVFAFVGVWITFLPGRWTLPLVLLASIVGFSRVAIGAHWPVDVLAGAVVGCMAAYTGICLSQVWRWGESHGSQWILFTLMAISAMTLPFIDASFPQSFIVRIVLTLLALGTVITLFGIPLGKRFSARIRT